MLDKTSRTDSFVQTLYIQAMKQALILGVTGNIGSAAARVLLAAGWVVTGVSRDVAKARVMEAHDGNEALRMVQGSVASEAGAAALAITLGTNRFDAIIANLNTTPARPETLLEWNAEALRRTIDDNLITHFIAAKMLIPRVAKGGTYLGVGGGMADRLRRGYGYNSMYQAALRMMFRYIDLEFAEAEIAVRQLVISAMIATRTRPNPGNTPFPWIADTDVGQHVRRILEQPAAFPGPIQLLDSPVGVGVSTTVDFTPQHILDGKGSA